MPATPSEHLFQSRCGFGSFPVLYMNGLEKCLSVKEHPSDVDFTSHEKG